MELFDSLNQEDAELLRHFGEDVSYSAGTIIFEKGDHGDSLYLVREGLIESVGKNGVILGENGPGELFGEMALIDGIEKRTSQARAAKDSRVSRYSVEKLRLLRESGGDSTAIAVQLNILRALCRKLRDREAAAYALESFRPGEVRTEKAMEALLRNLPREGFFGLFPKAHKLEAGKYLFLEDDSAPSFFVVTSGKLDIVTGGFDMEFPLNKLLAPTVVGETGFFLREKRSASVKAAMPLEYHEFTCEFFNELIEKEPQEALAIIIYLCKLVVHRIYSAEGG